MPSDLSEQEQVFWIMVFSVNTQGPRTNFNLGAQGFYEARRRADEAIWYIRKHGEYKVGRLEP